jgi:hypothetical protein
MRATLTRNGQDVGVFTMTRDGNYESHPSDEERERFDPIIAKIIEDLREPEAWVGRAGNVPQPVIYKPGDPRWFDKVLARLQNEGYEHVIVDGG